MNWQAVSFDWNQIRSFMATVDEGSLAAAARALGLTQPTLSRQIALLERELGVMLFDRSGRSLVLTDIGAQLLGHVRIMAEAASKISLAASGQSQSIAGRVSITASDMASAYFLPPILDKLREIAPLIEVEIVASNQLQDLSKREADIAIRHVRPQSPDLIMKRLRDVSAHLFANPAYFKRYKRPKSLSDLAQARYIGFETAARSSAALQLMGIETSAENFQYITGHSLAGLQMARQGLGLSLIPVNVARLFSDLQPVCPELAPVTGPVWLTTHRELHTSRRIRVVFDLIAEIMG